ncbi:response regulator transcription factor [Paenibacillus humicola]|uniref:response regulator transcription factor n=1 Tax=Paenibacillus humicola TaxID=3110540 RepID=UPI00237BE19B|nr:response regulator [Paenibacillus humicola]
MNTILLVDDDEYVINGLLRHIPWEDMGVRIVGTAKDGSEGLRKFRELRPDFVITDIYMPVMDGFQFTEEIHSLDPDVPVVILSGFDDFANARKAVTTGVQHFLLKPPSIAEIEFVVREVVRQLNESRERDELLASYVQQQDVVRRSMKDAFFRDLLYTRYRQEELPRQRIAFMGLPERPTVQVLTLSLVRSDSPSGQDEREWQLLRFGTGNIIRETLAGLPRADLPLFAEVLEYSDQRFVVVFLGGTAPADEVHDAVMQLSRAMLDNILQYMRLSTLAGLGTVAQGYERLIDSYLESRAALETAEMNEWNRIYVYAPQSEPERKKSVSLDAVRGVHDAFLQRRWLQALELWKQLGAELAGGSVPLPVMKGVCAGVASALWTAVQSAGLQPEPASEAGLDDLLLHLHRCGSARQLLDWMDNELVPPLIHQVREEMTDRKSHALIDRVIHEYIEKCYQENISLEQIASNLHVNRNYLSHLFKRITGEPFVTYFNKFRIRKAQELIRTGKYMVYEISEMVGFQNATYFSQVFKSITGYSPSEYKR